MSAYIGEKERSKINHLSFHLRKIGKEEQIKSKVKEEKIIRNRAKINKIENRESKRKSMKPKGWLFEKINKILTRLREKRKHNLLIAEIKEGTSLQIP